MYVRAQPKRKKAFKRNFDLRRIKRKCSYTLQEITELFGVHKNTIYLWMKQNLETIDGQKPYLIHGEELYRFLKKKQQSHKRSCKPNEFYCCKCRKPQFSWENVVDLAIFNKKQLVIKGICAICSTAITKLGAVKKIEEYESCFVVLALQQRHILDTTDSRSICDLKGY